MSAADLFSMKGRTALVTGASSGLGLHFAQVLQEAGATVILAARRTDRIEAEAARLGGGAAAVPMDVADEASVVAAFNHIDARHGGCDVVVNNAGTAASRLAIEMSGEEWDKVLDVNLRGAFLVAREGARRMAAARRPGSIVNIASVLGLRVLSGVAAYSASKAALIQLTAAMALELARHKIRVNAIAPGYFETELNSDWFATEHGQALIKRIPRRKLGDLRDLSGPLLLLASEAGANMTGATVSVDGGHAISSL